MIIVKLQQLLTNKRQKKVKQLLFQKTKRDPKGRKPTWKVVNLIVNPPWKIGCKRF